MLLSTVIFLIISHTMSRHHWNMMRIVESRPRMRSRGELKWNHIVSPEVVRTNLVVRTN